MRDALTHCSSLPSSAQAHVSSAWKTAMTGSSWVVTTSTLRNLSKSMSSWERLVFSLYMISSRWWRPRKYCRSLAAGGMAQPRLASVHQPLSGPRAQSEQVEGSQRPREADVRAPPNRSRKMSWTHCPPWSPEMSPCRHVAVQTPEPAGHTHPSILTCTRQRRAGLPEASLSCHCGSEPPVALGPNGATTWGVCNQDRAKTWTSCLAYGS